MSPVMLDPRDPAYFAEAHEEFQQTILAAVEAMKELHRLNTELDDHQIIQAETDAEWRIAELTVKGFVPKNAEEREAVLLLKRRDDPLSSEREGEIDGLKDEIAGAKQTLDAAIQRQRAARLRMEFAIACLKAEPV